MIIKIIVGIVFIAAFVGAGYFFLRCAESKDGNKVGTVFAAVLAIAIVIGFLLVPFSIRIVDAGEIAAVKHLGQINESRDPGAHFDLWITDRYQIYDTKVQSIDLEMMAYSSDAQQMSVHMTLQYQIMPEKVIDIAKQYGTEKTLESRISSISEEKSKSVLSSHTAMNIIAQRSAMSPAVEKVIMDAVGDEYYVNIIAVVITNIDFSDAFEQAVEEKMVAEQQQLKADYENKTKVARAEADANAKIIAAKAEAEANALLEKSLTDKILQEMYIDKWNGELPEVMSGADGLSIMIPSPTE